MRVIPMISSTVINDKVGVHTVEIIRNEIGDQKKIYALLGWISESDGGYSEKLGSSSMSPAEFKQGFCNPELARLIRQFQDRQAKKGKLSIRHCDGVVNPRGPTLALMNELAAREKPVPIPASLPPGGQPEAGGIWQITNIMSVRSGTFFATLLVEMLKRRGVPIDVDAVVIELSNPKNQRDYIIGPGIGGAISLNFSDMMEKFSKGPFDKSVIDAISKLQRELKSIESGSKNIKVLLKALSFKVESMKSGTIYPNPIFGKQHVSEIDLKVNSFGLNSFAILSAEAGMIATGGSQIVFFQPHAIHGVLGAQAIGVYGSLNILDSRIGANLKMMLFSNSRYVTGEAPPNYIPPGTPLPGGGVMPGWPFN
jgi:hypothetical protein